MCFNTRSIDRMESFSIMEALNTDSPNMGKLLLLLMTLDSADSLLESAVLDKENLIDYYKNIKRPALLRIAYKNT